MQRFNLLVGIIALSGDKVLLLQRSMNEKFLPGSWGIPAGKVDFGEKLENAVLRELHEETGLDGKVERIVGYSMFMSKKDGDELHNVQINFVVYVGNNQEVILSKSSEAYKWVSTQSINDENLDEFTVSTLNQVQ
jgi:8-oxo-dGTP pyrophosphatase MutT (NUDIX family)